MSISSQTTRGNGVEMQNRPIIIGVTGGSGGGKTSVSQPFLVNFRMKRLPWLSMILITRTKVIWPLRMDYTNYDHPFAFDTDLMIAQINEPWGLSGRYSNPYDYAEHTRSSETYRQNHKMSSSWKESWSFEDKRLSNWWYQDFRWYRWWCADYPPYQARYGERGRSLDSVILS